MPLDNALDNRKSNAASFDLIIGVQSLKYTEDFLGVPHVEADPVIGNPVKVVIAFGAAAKLDVDRLLGLGVLDRIGDQIEQDVPDRVGVGKRRWSVALHEVDLSIRIVTPFVSDDVAGHLAEIDCVSAQ